LLPLNQKILGECGQKSQLKNILHIKKLIGNSISAANFIARVLFNKLIEDNREM
jgi:hypothetical protein